MRIKYEMSDSQKRIILLTGACGKITLEELEDALRMSEEDMRLVLAAPRELSSMVVRLVTQQESLNRQLQDKTRKLERLEQEDKNTMLGSALYASLRSPSPLGLDLGVSSLLSEMDREEQKKALSSDVDGLTFLGLIMTDTGVFPQHLLLTDYGMNVYEKLRRGRSPILRSPTPQQRSVFIASAIGRRDTDQLFTKCLAPLCEDLEYDPIRIDLTEPLATITQGIVESISDARAVIADLTYARPSVYFEAGFAHGLGVPLLLTCRRDHHRGASEARRVHFDLEQYKISFWERGSGDTFSWSAGMAPTKRLRELLKLRAPSMHKRAPSKRKARPKKKP